MTADESTKQYLEAEAQANLLLDELIALRDEIESYQTATARLEGTNTALSSLTDRLQDVVTGVGDAVRKMQEIGLPALQEAQAKTSSSVAEERGEIATLRRQVSLAIMISLLGFAVVAALVVAL